MCTPTPISPLAASKSPSQGLSPLLLQHFQDRGRDVRKVQMAASTSVPYSKVLNSSSLPNLGGAGAQYHRFMLQSVGKSGNQSRGVKGMLKSSSQSLQDSDAMQRQVSEGRSVSPAGQCFSPMSVTAQGPPLRTISWSSPNLRPQSRGDDRQRSPASPSSTSMASTQRERPGSRGTDRRSPSPTVWQRVSPSGPASPNALQSPHVMPFQDTGTRPAGRLQRDYPGVKLSSSPKQLSSTFAPFADSGHQMELPFEIAELKKVMEGSAPIRRPQPARSLLSPPAADAFQSPISNSSSMAEALRVKELPTRLSPESQGQRMRGTLRQTRSHDFAEDSSPGGEHVPPPPDRPSSSSAMQRPARRQLMQDDASKRAPRAAAVPSREPKRDIGCSRAFSTFQSPKAVKSDNQKRSGCVCCSGQCACNPYGSDQPSEALEKSMHLQDTLWDLRRQKLKAKPPKVKEVEDEVPVISHIASTNLPEEEEAAKGSAEIDDDENGSLVREMLANKHDNKDLLKEMVANLEVGTESAAELGGCRHATAVIANRALAVAKRKEQLLIEVEKRVTEYEQLNKGRTNLVIQIAYQDADVPEGLLGIPKFIHQYAHPHCSPAEDVLKDSDFPTFVTTFGLHAEHDLLKQLKKMGDQYGFWWAEKTLELASKGADRNSRKARLSLMNGEKLDDSHRLGHAALKKIFSIAAGSGLDMESPKMREVIALLNDRLAEVVYQEAQKLQQADAENEEAIQNGSKTAGAIFGESTKAAEQIEKLIAECLADGCPDCHPKLELSRNVAKMLYNVDGERKRLAAREKRLAQKK